MNQLENVVKIGKAVLTPNAISFIETLQDENNSIIRHYNKILLELIVGVNCYMHDGDVPDELKERLIKNMGELSGFVFELEHLQKP